jgi:hypothetical protein
VCNPGRLRRASAAALQPTRARPAQLPTSAEPRCSTTKAHT